MARIQESLSKRRNGEFPWSRITESITIDSQKEIETESISIDNLILNGPQSIHFLGTANGAATVSLWYTKNTEFPCLVRSMSFSSKIQQSICLQHLFNAGNPGLYRIFVTAASLTTSKATIWNQSLFVTPLTESPKSIRSHK